MSQHATRASSTPNLSPTPPGVVPTQIGASTAPPASSRSSTPLPALPPSHAPRHSSSTMYPLSPVSPVFSPNLARSGSRARRPGMEPVLEDSSTDQRVNSESRQLPSPPASPDQPQPTTRGSRRPSLAGSHSSSPALPFRPRSSTVTGPSMLLAGAFRSNPRHSTAPSPHVSSTLQAHPPSVPSSSAQSSRSRATSVDFSSQAQDIRPAIDAFRRMSTTDIRQLRPSTAVREDAEREHAFLRTSDALRAPPHYDKAGHSSARKDEPRVAHQSASTASASAQAPRPSTSHGHPETRSYSHQNQPVLVKRKDSLALRPIPVSHFMQPGVNRTLGGGSTRPRSSSVMSERSLPRPLPPIDPSSPLELSVPFSHSSESEEGTKRSTHESS
ncbi:uncharacterized protein LAESUDRAFT_718080 [Laetiporus sulphureus 93-53]|uniref:Uncharacterized protein n=1 Tax=Laetiporus sulphureus 93-53 TaxID=1314785 RepID=A0A165B938_9APHY|nr:uncharacterized protein LAESUDRAFT_718080 [Laetiporus sulphureus 93-53]KZT00529.1 hypothetical protein LAESUDRAFT_718080 [Laetiporus sulphureus 93-53]